MSGSPDLDVGERDASRRADVLRGLADAYLAIAEQPTLDDRLAEVCAQAKAFLGAADAVLVFHRRNAPPDEPGIDTMVAELAGSNGLLIIHALPGRTWTDEDRATLAQLARLISPPVDDARRLDYARQLERVGAAVARAADLRSIVTRFADEVVAKTDIDGITVLVGDGPAHSAGDRGPTAHQSEQDRLLASVADTGTPVFLGTPASIAGYLGTANDGEIAEGAWAAVPVPGPDGNEGVLGVWFCEQQPVDVVQRAFVDHLADRLGTALRRGAAFERERSARERAEVASNRLADLQELAVRLSQATTQRRVAQVLLRRALQWSGATGGAVATLDGERSPSTLVGRWPATGGSGEGPAADLLTDVLAELHPLGLAADAGAISDDLRRRIEAVGVRSLAAVPVEAGGRYIGLLVLGWDEPFAAEVVDDFLRAQVALAGPALARAERYDIEHLIADTLQRSILTLPDPNVDGVRWAAAYRAGSAGLAGGDWYDIYPLDDRRVAIVVGDVVGRGVHAAAAMGQLRSATRATARLVDDPAAVLEALDEFVTSTGQGRFSTAAYSVLDTVTGELAHASAGHPPPVIRLPDGSVDLLETGRGPLLGVGGARSSSTRHLPMGTRIVLYTDGLVERRDESVDAGLRRLLDHVAVLDGDVDLASGCDRLVAELAPAIDDVDDVAVLAVEVCGAPTEAPTASP